jgi:hypothetical protein
VEPRDVDTRAWQAHVLKHPLGLGSLYGLGGLSGVRRWNAEGWDTTEPTTISVEERTALTKRIGELQVNGVRCAADRLEHLEYGGESPYREVPCYNCLAALAALCRASTQPLGDRYAGWLSRALESLADGVEVPRKDAAKRLFLDARRPDAELPLVLSTGLLANQDRGARINAPNGVRSDLYYNHGTLTWRTTYRDPPGSLADRLSFLLQVLPPISGMALSGSVLVPRRWWERNPS